MLSLQSVQGAQQEVKEIVAGLARQPEFRWQEAGTDSLLHMDSDGTPAARVAIANTALDTDIWCDVRSPAAAGLHPLTFRDIWDYYAANNVSSVSRDGSPNYLAMPTSFDEAQSRFTRAVVVSVLVPISPDVFAGYASHLSQGSFGNLSAYTRAAGDASKMVTLATERLAISLLGKGRVVVPMTPAGAGNVEDFTRAQAQRGSFHGPCNNTFPQSSIAVLTGLMQFGVSRLPMRDEITDAGDVSRLMGHYASIVLFDSEPLITDGAGGIVHIDDGRLAAVRRLSDFTDVSANIVSQRYCAYNQTEEGSTSSVCGQCVKNCPAGAVLNSVPSPDGTYSESIQGQKRRFDGGFLKFDFANCAKERNQKKQVYSEYACARCLVMCAALGKSNLGARA